MTSQRGWMGYLFLLALAGAGWVGWGAAPIFLNDYGMRRVVQRTLGDYVVFLIEEDAFPKTFAKHAIEMSIDVNGIEPTYEVDPKERNWAKGTVAYERTWKIPGLKKVYTQKFRWTVKEDR